MLNQELLANAIKRSGKTNKFLAEKLGMSSTGFYLKRSAKNDFTTSEIYILCHELNLKKNDMVKIFFDEK